MIKRDLLPYSVRPTRAWMADRHCFCRKARGDHPAAAEKNGLQTWVLGEWVKSAAARVEEPEEHLQAVPDPTEELRRDQNPVVVPDPV